MTAAPPDRHQRMAEICALAPVVPVLVVEDADKAVPLAKALVAGGLPVLEVTLRTEAALAAITAMAEACPDAVVGVGTLRRAEDVAAARQAGAQFGVSPGCGPSVLAAAAAVDWPLLPGVATPTEAMTAAEQGYGILKLFPASAVGGMPLLKALASPLKGIRFCPTGGIDATNARQYLALDNVACVGGSWVAPKSMVAEGDWAGIERLAASAAALGA